MILSPVLEGYIWMQENINILLGKCSPFRPLFSLKCALDRNRSEQIPAERLSNNIYL